MSQCCRNKWPRSSGSGPKNLGPPKQSQVEDPWLWASTTGTYTMKHHQLLIWDDIGPCLSIWACEALAKGIQRFIGCIILPLEINMMFIVFEYP